MAAITTAGFAWESLARSHSNTHTHTLDSVFMFSVLAVTLSVMDSESLGPEGSKMEADFHQSRAGQH